MEAILFIGIQASGKTTLYKDRFLKTHIRLSLDQLRTRSREAKFLDVCINTKQSFVVDNTNPGQADRARYIIPAKEKGFRIIGYYFNTRIDEALLRNCQRPGKEYKPERAVIATSDKIRIPTVEEGFDELYRVEIVNDRFVIEVCR